MKKMLLVLLSFITLSAQAQLASITTYNYGDEVDANPEVNEAVLKLYKSQIKDKNSILFLALRGFAYANELSFMEEDYNEASIGSMSVDFEDTLFAGSGKGSCCSYGSTTLVPIWGDYKGTGLIREIIGFIKVYVSVELGEDAEETTYSIEKIIPFSSY